MHSLYSFFLSLFALAAAHPYETTVAVGVVLSVINGLLPARVQASSPAAGLHFLLDRLSVLTRSDAKGTLKWPLIAGSLLRATADVLDPPRPPRVPPTGAMMLLVVALGTAVIPPGCHPQPAPDGGVITPSGVVAAIETVASLLDVLLPLIRPLLQRNVPDAARPAVMVSLTVFEDAARAWQAGYASWDARGADRCTAYALSGALVDATRQLVRDLGRSGVGWGPDLEALLTSLGRIQDRILGACPGADGGALASSGRVGDSVRAFLDGVALEARSRGVSLRPLPAVDR